MMPASKKNAILCIIWENKVSKLLYILVKRAPSKEEISIYNRGITPTIINAFHILFVSIHFSGSICLK